MTMTSATLLPGVYFQTAVPAVPEALPRLDIPAFVGFAASGPIHIPVVVEDVAGFREVFGGRQPLAWDSSSGEVVNAQLAPAVDVFFSNGGRRCWVVRVARKFLSSFEQAEPNQARSNEFVVPGLLQLNRSGACEAAWLQARSEGSWSDALEVDSTLSYAAIEFVAVRPRVDGYELELDAASPISASPGDVLQLVVRRSGTAGIDERDAVGYLPVTRTETASLVSPPRQARLVITGAGVWFDVAFPDDFQSFVSSPPAATSSEPFWLPLPGRVWWLTRADNQQLSPAGWGVRNHQFFFLVSRADAGGIQAGSWLRAEFDAPVGPGKNILLIQVQNVHGTTVDRRLLPPGSPPSGEELVEIIAGGAWWQLDGATAAQRSSGPLVGADVVTLELWVRDLTGQVFRLSDLGLASLHPRYLGALPTDAELFSSPPLSLPPNSSLLDNVTHPRFALAAPAFDQQPPFFVPLGVAGVIVPEYYEQAVPRPEPALERDGLKEFSPALFLDPDLSDTTVDSLLTEAFHKQYQLQRDPTASAPGEPLQGMHSILPIEEVSVLCVPDAPNRGWKQSMTDVDILGAPQNFAVTSVGSGGAVASWDPVPGALSYTVEQSLDPRFADQTTAWEGQATPSGSLPPPDGCLKNVFYRARANGHLGPGPWSETRIFSFLEGPFAPCDPGLLDAPTFLPLAMDRGLSVLEWTGAAGADAFILQASPDATFEFGSMLYQGGERNFSVAQGTGTVLYYRVAAQRGSTLSPWSNTIFTLPSTSASWELEPLSGSTLDDVVSKRGKDLNTIHQAMLRLCAARGDMVALLSVPVDFETDACVLYRQQLSALLASDGANRTLSFGALFHPWLMVSDSPGLVTSIVPDGGVAGVIAARTINAGAWYSAAYQVLEGVLGLAPALPASSRARFFTEQINLIEQDPRGFIAGSSTTLSGDAELAELTVRRLLILLRRLALRDGMTFVFEPNDDNFQRRVRREFEDLLRMLYMRGAFAGSSPDQAFRVVADRSVNTQEDLDQGRFIVELRVAPSRPLAFLTVRLVQAGGQLTVGGGD